MVHSSVITTLSNDFYQAYGDLLQVSFKALTGNVLMEDIEQEESAIHALWKAPFVLVSHGTEESPVFNFGNKLALELFECTWGDFIQLPSKKSAEPVAQEERDRLLSEVTSNGFIRNYSGVRVSSTGKRFTIENAIVWNLIDKKKGYCGQAALFKQWTFL